MIDKYGNVISWIPKYSDSKLPKYLAIAKALEDDINNHILEAGHKLPPQRILADYLNISHSTITKAYKACENKGLIKGTTGKGTFVNNNFSGLSKILLPTYSNPNLIEMGLITPLNITNKFIDKNYKAVTKVIDFETVLNYTPPEGHLSHRIIASNWLNQFNVKCDPKSIIITPGSQNALAVVLSSLFNKGDRIIVDEITYPGIKSLAELLGIVLVTVESDKDGINIEKLISSISREQPKGIYLIPNCQNPTTIVMSDEKKMKLVEIIIKKQLFLIEDDPFIFINDQNTYPLYHYLPDKCIYIVGTSKIFNPTFRIAFICSPQAYLNQLTHGVNSLSLMASSINAEIISHLLLPSKFNELTKITLNELRIRNSIADKILGEYELFPSELSMFRFLILPDTISNNDVESSCLIHGVRILSSSRFLVRNSKWSNSIRIAISNPQTLDELEQGLLIINRVIKFLLFGKEILI